VATWYQHTLTAIYRFFGGAVLEPDEETFRAGSDFGTDQAAHKELQVSTGMSAVARFAWVYACTRVRSDDLAGLPLKAYRRQADGSLKEDPGHPFLALMEQPNSGESGTMVRAQVYADHLASGDGYLMPLLAVTEPASIVRLLPYRVRPVPGAYGWPVAYDYDERGSVKRYDAKMVAHIRSLSWEDGPPGSYGLSPIRPLVESLKAEDSLEKFNAKAASRGRVDVLISPSDSETIFGPDVAKDIRRDWERISAKGGALINGRNLKVEPLSLTPRDLEGQALHERNREAILAAFRVPPVRVGLPGANYATSRQQMKVYWESLQADSVMLNAAYTKIARLWGSSANVVIAHDFSGVEALQVARTEQVARATSHILNGMDATTAYAYEGLDGAEFRSPEPIATPAKPPKANEDEAAEPTDKGLGWLYPVEAKQMDERGQMWADFIARVHRPQERRLSVVLRRFLARQGRRIAAKLPEAIEEQRAAVGAVTRSTEDLVLGVVFDEAAEAEALAAATRSIFLEVMRLGFVRAGAELGDLTFDPDRAPIARLLSDMSDNVNRTTALRVRAIIEQGIAEGLSVKDMAKAIEASAAFSPNRAMLIARTETTSAVEAGSAMAHAEAAEMGIQFHLQWLSARDDKVRDSHIALDAQEVLPGQEFRDPLTGQTALHPGGFGDPAQDANCRCTTIPVRIGG